jgi:hypothetical protein
MRSHEIANLMSTTVRVLENAPGTRRGTESLPKVFLHDNCEQISFIIFFAFLKKEEMRSGTHFTQLNVFLLLTVVLTKHVWPYFQSRFPKTSSERVSSCGCDNERRLKQSSHFCNPSGGLVSIKSYFPSSS